MNWRNTSNHQDRYYDHPATQLFSNFTEWFEFLESQKLRTYFNGTWSVVIVGHFNCNTSSKVSIVDRRLARCYYTAVPVVDSVSWTAPVVAAELFIYKFIRIAHSCASICPAAAANCAIVCGRPPVPCRWPRCRRATDLEGRSRLSLGRPFEVDGERAHLLVVRPQLGLLYSATVCEHFRHGWRVGRARQCGLGLSCLLRNCCCVRPHCARPCWRHVLRRQADGVDEVRCGTRVCIATRKTTH